MRSRCAIGAAVSTAFLAAAGTAISASAATSSGGAAVSNGLPVGLGWLASPPIAFALLMVALLGVGLEAVHPGAVIPGTIGVIAGALATAGLLNMSLDLLGLLLLAAAGILFAADLAGHSHGVLSVAAIGAAIAGGLLLFSKPGVETSADVGAMAAVAVATGSVWLFLSRRALAARRLPVATSTHELLGAVGVVQKEASAGQDAIALVEGELWRVEPHHAGTLEKGQEVEVLARDGLTLIVEPRTVLAAPLAGGSSSDQNDPQGG